jgi:hypothetical protein
VKICLNVAFNIPLTKLNQKSIVIKWYNSGDSQETTMMLDDGCPQLEEGINYKDMGLKRYRGIVMAFGYSPGMDDRCLLALYHLTICTAC